MSLFFPASACIEPSMFAIVHEAIESILLATEQLPETVIGIKTCILY